MAASGTLHDAFLDELRDVFDAEKQLLKALPKMAKAATADGLRDAIENHFTETQEHVSRLEQVFSSLDEKARGKHCEGIAGIIEEAKGALEEDCDEATMDAMIIASGQRAEHYEIAAYGTLVAWARAMGYDEAAGLLEETLQEEKAADETLTGLAEGGINDEAAQMAHPDGMDEDAADEAEAEAPPPAASSRKKPQAQAQTAPGGRSAKSAKSARQR